MTSTLNWIDDELLIELADLRDLVRGRDRALIDRLTPLVRRQNLALDLSHVQRIDAAGIAALISLYGSARDTGHNFSVINPSPRVAEILAIVGLDRIHQSHNTGVFSQYRPEENRPAA